MYKTVLIDVQKNVSIGYNDYSIDHVCTICFALVLKKEKSLYY